MKYSFSLTSTGMTRTVRLHRTVLAPVRTVRPVRRFLKNELFALFEQYEPFALFAVRTVRCSHDLACSHCSLMRPNSEHVYSQFGGPCVRYQSYCLNYETQKVRLLQLQCKEKSSQRTSHDRSPKSFQKISKFSTGTV